MKQAASYIWSHSPHDLLRETKRRLRGKDGYDYSLEGVLHSSKHMKPVTLIDRWERYWRVIMASKSAAHKERFDFEQKVVFELGCGPLLGWGPMAVYCGAQEFRYFEPNLQWDVVASDAIRESYFRGLHRELESNFGPRMDFDQFRDRVLSRSHMLDPNQALTGKHLDIVLSNSVLEHVAVQDLADLLRALGNLSGPGAAHFHSVDFGPHGIVEAFEDLYVRPPSRKWVGNRINLLRSSEIKAHLVEAGLDVEVIPYKTRQIDLNKVDKYWKRFAESDLSLNVAFFVSAT